MSYHTDKANGDLVIDGFDQGISPSPHKGIANIQGANISTELEEIMSSYNRVAQLTSAAGSSTLTPTSNSTVSFSPTIAAGTWFTITADSGTGLSGNYYYLGAGQISQTFNGAPVTTIYTNTPVRIFLTTGSSWSVPADWNNNFNSIEVIAGGGSGGGFQGEGTGGGGGGGAYSKVTNLTLAGSITYNIGAGGVAVAHITGIDGGDTYFNGANFAASSVAAKAGKGADVNGLGGLGGDSSLGIGTLKYSGGAGGTSNPLATAAFGGGGAGGPNGVGADGTLSSGGTGGNTFGGIGGTAAHPGNPGGAGTEYDGTHGSGGGGGGNDNAGASFAGGAGGLYGGGGGGTTYTANPDVAGNGSQGLIIITYVPATPITTSAIIGVRVMGSPLQSTTEPYYDNSNNQQYRYYILDSLGDIWVHDTAITSPIWFSPLASLPANLNAPPSGLSVLNGWLSVAYSFSTIGSYLFWISTSMLNVSFNSTYQLLSNHTHATLVGNQNILYYTDGNIVGSVFPNTGPLTSGVNIQSYCSWTAPSFGDNTVGTISALIGGSVPFISSTTRVPVVFFTPGTLPASMTAGTIYYVQMVSGSNIEFQVFDAASGGSAKDITTGSSGLQYFNTFYPVSNAGLATIVISRENLYLPFSETSQSIARLGSVIIIGGKSNTLYSWDGINSYPTDLIPLAENNVVNLLTVNNMLYVFAGSKGNIYVCNGSSASLAIAVPDYCAGIPGTPNTYIEPYFTWGGVMFLRGRIWFSILDQTAIKSGNCGGIWSFVPTNNLYIGQDTGLALRQENQSSYGTYNGVSPVLLANQNQSGIGAQYWNAWYSSITSPLYGIDYTGTIPTTQTLIETDLIPIGTMLGNWTAQQIEYKLVTSLTAGETIGISYRLDGTSAYVSCGTVKNVMNTDFSGYFSGNFQNAQWLQFQITLNPIASTSSSFCRLKEIRIR